MTEPETYGINLTPHFEKYQNQDQETADIMQKTWNFGNTLKANGYKVAYMHGPVAVFEDQVLYSQFYNISNLEDFEKEFSDKNQYLFFLQQKLSTKIKLGKLLREDVDLYRKLQPKKKKQKKSPKKTNLAVDKPL